MEDIVKKDATELQSSIDRRNFLRLAAVSGVGFMGAAPALGAGESRSAGETPCPDGAASSILALFSVRTWQLPNKLRDAVAAGYKEKKLYTSFETPFRELVELAKKLKVKCEAVTRNDPRLNELTRLADDAARSARFLTTASVEDEKIAYSNLVALVATGRDITRTAGDVASEHLQDSDETVCKMLEKIKEMEGVKVELDEARKQSQLIFSDFVTTIGLINKTIIDASESAASFERGDLAEKEKAIATIKDAQSRIRDLEARSSGVQDGMITPHELRMLLEVPKAMLEGDIPPVTSLNRYSQETGPFRSVSYVQGETGADAAFATIQRIIVKHILPGDWWTVRLLALAVFGVLRLYGENPPRTRLVGNALQSVPWVSARSNIPAATAALVKIVI